MIGQPAAGILAVAGIILIVAAVVTGGRHRGRRAGIAALLALAGTACELISYAGYGIHYFHP